MPVKHATCGRGPGWMRLYRGTLLAVLLGPLSCRLAPAQAVQGVQSDPSTAYDQAIDLPPDPSATDVYDAPDVPKKWTDWAAYKSKEFSYKVTLVPILDYSAFSQDQASLAQVGKQDDQWEVRSMRLSLGGQVNYGYQIKYLFGVEYKGFGQPEGAKGWASTDVALTFPLGPEKYGSITAGKIKETVSYEMVGDSANLPQLERLLNPFFTSRDVGLRYNNTLFDKTMTVSAGWFNDWWTKGRAYDGSSNHYTARITGVPYWAGTAPITCTWVSAPAISTRPTGACV
jgi:phosphate-selective porin OprO and OprP